MSTSVVIADFGTGNLHSVITAIQAVGGNCKVESSRLASKIRAADRLVLPGQGAIGTWMKEFADDEVRQSVEYALLTKPVLGICLGLQALYHHSDEDGGVEGLGVLDGYVKRFDSGLVDAGRKIKVPHMGWSVVYPTRQHPLWQGILPNTRFYFVHSYLPVDEKEEQVAAQSNYGVDFTCAAAEDNLFAVQFHPEKSRGQGLRLLSNFLSWDGID